MFTDKYESKVYVGLTWHFDMKDQRKLYDSATGCGQLDYLGVVIGMFLVIGKIMDLPLSAAADTLLLPLTLTGAIGSPGGESADKDGPEEPAPKKGDQQPNKP